MDLFEQISNDIKEAMKAKDKVRLETLRNVKKCFLEAKTAPGANDTLTDEAALKIMQKLVKQGKDSAANCHLLPHIPDVEHLSVHCLLSKLYHLSLPLFRARY